MDGRITSPRDDPMDSIQYIPKVKCCNLSKGNVSKENAAGYIKNSPPAQSKVGDGAKLAEKGAHRLLIESVGYVGDVDHSPATMFRHTFH